MLKADTSTTYTKSEVDALIGNNALSETTPISYMGTIIEQNICTDSDFKASSAGKVYTWASNGSIYGPYFELGNQSIDTNNNLIGTIVNQSTYSGFTSASVQHIYLIYQNVGQSSYNQLDIPFTRDNNTFKFSYTFPTDFPTTIRLTVIEMTTSTAIATLSLSNTELKAKLTLDTGYPATITTTLKDYIDMRIAASTST